MRFASRFVRAVLVFALAGGVLVGGVLSEILISATAATLSSGATVDCTATASHSVEISPNAIFKIVAGASCNNAAQGMTSGGATYYAANWTPPNQPLAKWTSRTTIAPGAEISFTQSTAGLYQIYLVYRASGINTNIVTITITVSAGSSVTFNSQGGSTVAPLSYEAGGSITLPVAPTRSRHTFTGWYSAANGGTRVGGAGDSYSPAGSASITLYAQWTQTHYLVSYSAEGGSATPSQEVAISQSMPLPAAPTRSGYTFTGWYTAAGGGVKAGDAGANYTPTADVTLYAQWSANTLTVTFDSRGGSAVANGSVKTDAPIVLDPGSPTRSGYAFTGWFTAATGGSKVQSFPYAHGQTADFTLYAQWNVVWAVQIELNGGTAKIVSTDKCSATSTGHTCLVVPPGYMEIPGLATKVGYSFVNWTTGPNATGATQNAGLYYPTADVTLYANYSLIVGTLTLDQRTPGVSPTAEGTYSVETPATFTLPTPARTGYTFDGWFTAASGGTKITASPYDPIAVNSHSSHTLYAQWTADTHTVTFNSQGGSSVTGASFPTDGSVTLLGPPSKDGYTFAGWYTAASGGVKAGDAGASYTPSVIGPITLHAQWTANTYTVKFDSRGGSGVADAAYQTGGSVVLPTPTRSGYSFAGWYTAPSDGAKVTSPYAPASGGTVYARWTANQYTIKYSIGGVESSDTSTFTTGGSFTLLTPQGPTGKRFTGWYRDDALSVVVGAAGATETPTSYTDQTLYGAWVDYQASFSLSGADASCQPARIGFDAGAAITLPALPAGCKSARLLEWFSDSALNNSVGMSGDPYTVPNPSASGTTIYGKYTPLHKTWWISQPEHKNGFAVSDTAPFSFAAVGEIVTLPETPKYANKEFAGWGPSKITAPFLQTATTTSTMNAYCRYWLYFDAQGGSGGPADFSEDYECPFTFNVNLPVEEPKKAGYKFSGWKLGGTNFTYTRKDDGFVTIVESWYKNGYFFTAQYSLDTSTAVPVTFDSAGGSAVTPGQWAYDKTFDAPTPPTRSGYTFAGWSETVGGPAVTFPFKPSTWGAVTLYARWTAVTTPSRPSGPRPNPPQPPQPPKPPAPPVRKPSTDPQSPLKVPPAVVSENKPTAIALPTTSSSVQIATQLLPETKGIAEAKIVDGAVTFKPEPTFSGKTIVPLEVVTDGVTTIVEVPVVVNPVTPEAGVVVPKATSRSALTWDASPNAVAYEVRVNGELVCSGATSAACSVPKLLGPAAKVEVTAIGNDNTRSETILPVYAPTKPVPAFVVNFAENKATLNAKSIRKLNDFIALMREQGFTNVFIEGHTDGQGGAKGSTKLSAARAAVVAKYLSRSLDVAIRTVAAGAAKPVASNATAAGQAKNRRAVGSVQ